jgi:hypothetical protein
MEKCGVLILVADTSKIRIWNRTSLLQLFYQFFPPLSLDLSRFHHFGMGDKPSLQYLMKIHIR